MKEITKRILLKELNEHRYNPNDIKYNLDRLFKIYTICEIREKDDLFKNHRVFTDFVMENQNKFTFDSELSKEFFRNSSNMTIRWLTLFADSYSDSDRAKREAFVSKIQKITNNKLNKILDVGSGFVPYSSILLAKTNDVTSMDNCFVLANESLRNLKVKPVKKYFNENTDVSRYDIVIGQKPCSAIKPIVKQCVKNCKPYFITLCECDAPQGKVENWIEELKKFDPNIQFKHDDNGRDIDAFNL